MAVQPYKVHVPDSVLQDLKDRLARTRWPDEIPGSGWDYGSNLDYIKELVEYWRTEFDWRAQEEAINRFAHFTTDIEGLNIHFIHERGKGPNPIPLVITHGWPSTIFEILKVVEPLTDPVNHGGSAEDSFDVVVPSMPGYGFSSMTTERGMNPAKVGDLWVKLMRDELGYSRFAAQGGDWGASVTAHLGFTYPEEVIGIHVTSASGVVAGSHTGPGMAPLTEAEQIHVADREQWRQDEGGYSHIQGTKPQTLSYGLNDSPAGLAAWIVEKFRTWSDCGGDVESSYTKDELLTTVTIYWATGTINSSTRLYYESQRNPLSPAAGQKMKVPSGIAVFPHEISRPPREWAERAYDLRRWTEMLRGGHFAAMEEPELLVEDIRAFFRDLRN